VGEIRWQSNCEDMPCAEHQTRSVELRTE
jgi:hypothetical protein